MELPQAEPYKTGLKVNNTLKKSLEEFVPISGRTIKFYNCGPTVYDASHMGHARTYISVDMIRRILTKYFNYDLMFCMNITDIDDKIILRSNEKGEEFSKFARKWENDFWADMQALGVDYPDVVVRVSEHVQENVNFIQKIIDNGFAYESNGSVYFDVAKFMEAPNHYYAKLDPAKVRDISQQEDEEPNPDKRDRRDFALWKTSKPKEPFWPSPWSNGRPGWHIECSTMADYVLGWPIDIHMGGIDLKFPHHDNEIAQSEAYYNKPTKEENQWVNYFIHTGHLHIDGLKMSKSLKNFITIKNLLRHFSARQLRLLFVIHSFDQVMDYYPHTEDEQGNIVELRSMREAVDKDKYYVNFMRTIIAILRQTDISQDQKWEQKEFTLQNALTKTKQNIHNHFLNNFNTQGVIKELDQIISETNTYMNQKGVRKPLLQKLYNYITFIFECIGLDFDDNSAKTDAQEIFLKEIQTISQFRDQVREFGQKGKQFDKIEELAKENIAVAEQFKSEVKEIFANYVSGILAASQAKNFGELMNLCDNIRDEQLPTVGIKIDDRNGEPSLWKQEDKDVLMKEMQQKKELKLKQAAEKAQKEKEKELKKQQELEQMKINPAEMFLKNPNYTQFDESGLPTHDKEGKELNKKNQKYVKKEYDNQMKKYTQYLKTLEEQKQ